MFVSPKVARVVPLAPTGYYDGANDEHDDVKLNRHVDIRSPFAPSIAEHSQASKPKESSGFHLSHSRSTRVKSRSSPINVKPHSSYIEVNSSAAMGDRRLTESPVKQPTTTKFKGDDTGSNRRSLPATSVDDMEGRLPNKGRISSSLDAAYLRVHPVTGFAWFRRLVSYCSPVYLRQVPTATPDDRSFFDLQYRYYNNRVIVSFTIMFLIVNVLVSIRPDMIRDFPYLVALYVAATVVSIVSLIVYRNHTDESSHVSKYNKFAVIQIAIFSINMTISNLVVGGKDVGVLALSIGGVVIMFSFPLRKGVRIFKVYFSFCLAEIIFLYANHKLELYTFPYESCVTDFGLLTLAPIMILGFGVLIWDFVSFMLFVSRNVITIQHKLEKANKRLSESTRVKDNFLSVMSHELRTPLNAVLGLGEILGDSEKLETDERDMLMTSMSSCKMLLSLFDDILDYANANAGRIVPVTYVVNIKEEISSCVDAFRWQCLDSGKQLSLKFTDKTGLPDSYQVKIDGTRVVQIINNFLKNALTHSTSCIVVTYKTRLSRMAHNAILLEVSVSDDGSGISEGAIMSIFEPFNQLDNSISRKHSGVGLGLSLCKTLADALGANINVQSQRGNGSTFSLQIRAPIVTPETTGRKVKRHHQANKISRKSPQQGSEPVMMASVKQLSKMEQHRPKQLQQRGGHNDDSKTSQSVTDSKSLQDLNVGDKQVEIIIVDDIALNCRVLVRMCRQAGVTVPIKTFMDPLQAVAFLHATRDEGHHFLLLLDLHMPKVAGFDVYTKLAAIPNLMPQHLQCVAVTADTSARQKCLDMGFAGFLAKPYTVQQLQDVIWQCLP